MTHALASDWWEKAQCQGRPTEDFYPDSSTASIPLDIQRLCDTCPVQGDCLTHALIRRESGIWGGTTESQRTAIMSKNLRKFCLKCKSPNIHASKRFMVCLACGLSWRIS